MINIRIIVLLILFPTISFSQDRVIPSSTSKTTIVNNISQLLLDNYVFPDKAAEMSNHIKNQLKMELYDKIIDPVEFSDALTIDLYSIYHDGHMLVQFVPEELNEKLNVPSTISNQTHDDDDDDLKKYTARAKMCWMKH